MKVHIKNFQSAADVELEIKGFTTIVGKSNIGKSAIIRAIQGALTNREGDSFVTKGESHTEVALKIPNLSLVWKKGGGYNDYDINGEKLESVGRGCPPHIEEAGFGELKLGRDSINVQVADQFHPLFLLNESGALAAEAISDVGRLKDVQEALRSCDKDRRSVRSTKKVRQEDLDQAREELNRYENYEDDMKQVQEVRAYYKDITALNKEIELISSYDAKRLSTVKQVEHLDGVLDVEVPSVDLDTLIKELGVLERFSARLKRGAHQFKKYKGVDALEVPDWEHGGLLSEIELLERLASKASKVQGALKTYKGVDTLEVPSVDDFTDDRVAFESLESMSVKLQSLVATIPGLKRDIKEYDQELESIKEELHDVLHEAGSCPTCERDIQ